MKVRRAGEVSKFSDFSDGHTIREPQMRSSLGRRWSIVSGIFRKIELSSDSTYMKF